MDAVSFAVGLQSKDLRGRQLKDLIYRADGEVNKQWHYAKKKARIYPKPQQRYADRKRGIEH